MALALTKIQAYGIEAQEPIFKRNLQVAILSLTGANTDATIDLGQLVSGSLGTFWTAVSGTDPGLSALTFFREMKVRADNVMAVQSQELETRNKVGDGIVALLSAASAGGAAAEPYTVTGLATTDTIVAVSPTVAPANAVYMKAYGTQVANGLTVTYSGDPGAGGKVTVAVRRNGSGAVAAGEYNVAFANGSPNLTFASGDAPTAWNLVVWWVLVAGQEPINLYADTNGPAVV